MGLNLKIFNNLSSATNEQSMRHGTHQEQRRLEATILREVGAVLQGRITVACFEIAEHELGTMLEVVASPDIQARYIVQQTEIPTQFLFFIRDLQVF